MLVYLLYFIEAIIFLASLNALFHHVKNSYFSNKDHISRIDSGRIKNFETGKSESQQKPVFTY